MNRSSRLESIAVPADKIPAHIIPHDRPVLIMVTVLPFRERLTTRPNVTYDELGDTNGYRGESLSKYRKHSSVKGLSAL